MREGCKKTLKKNIEPISGKVNESDENNKLKKNIAGKICFIFRNELVVFRNVFYLPMRALGRKKHSFFVMARSSKTEKQNIVALLLDNFSMYMQLIFCNVQHTIGGHKLIYHNRTKIYQPSMINEQMVYFSFVTLKALSYLI